MEQWPLSEEKLLAAQRLVQEQLAAGHIVPSSSPIFIIKKKSGSWQLLQNLRQVNKGVEVTGSVQPGLPKPVAIPKDYCMVMIDLKDCCFTIPLHPEDPPKFAFSIPTKFQRATPKVSMGYAAPGHG